MDLKELKDGEAKLESQCIKVTVCIVLLYNGIDCSDTGNVFYPRFLEIGIKLNK